MVRGVSRALSGVRVNHRMAPCPRVWTRIFLIVTSCALPWIAFWNAGLHDYTNYAGCPPRSTSNPSQNAGAAAR